LSMILVPMHVLNLYDIPNIGGNSQSGWGCEVAVVNMKVLMAWQLYWSCFAPETPLALWAKHQVMPWKVSSQNIRDATGWPKSGTPGHWNIQTCTAWDVLGCLEASVFQYPMERGKNRTSKIDKHTQARAYSML
jgi:hypothetical protein